MLSTSKCPALGFIQPPVQRVPGLFSGIKRAGMDVDHFPSITELKNEFSYTGLFISPSGTSELDCATTKTDTAESSTSIGRESLKVFFCIRRLGVLAGSTARG